MLLKTVIMPGKSSSMGGNHNSQRQISHLSLCRRPHSMFGIIRFVCLCRLLVHKGMWQLITGHVDRESGMSSSLMNCFVCSQNEC